MDAAPPHDPAAPAVADDDGPDRDRPAPATRPERPPPWWRSWWALGAAVLLVAVVVTAVGLVTTQRSTNQAHTDVDDARSAGQETQVAVDQAYDQLRAQREELRTALAKATAADGLVLAATSRRDDTASQVESARSELNTLSGLLNKQRAIVYVQAKLVADLSDCVNAANQALNFLSFGDKDQGTKLLQDSTAKCESASQYLANLPAKP